jgi:hypothetical protein
LFFFCNESTALDADDIQIDPVGDDDDVPPHGKSTIDSITSTTTTITMDNNNYSNNNSFVTNVATTTTIGPVNFSFSFVGSVCTLQSPQGHVIADYHEMD